MIKQCKIRKYHSENCDFRVRKVKKDAINRIIILTGQHAFEYTIHIVSNDKKSVTSIKYSNRETAIKKYNKIK